MTPDVARAWQRVLRDFALIAIGSFLLIFGTIWVREPTRLGLILGAGMAMFGLPPFLRLDAKRRTDDEE